MTRRLTLFVPIHIMMSSREIETSGQAAEEAVMEWISVSS